jgi:uncharacterized protein (DUF2147 family)
MYLTKKKGLLFMALALFSTQCLALSPIGNWATISDETKRKRAIVSIKESKGQLSGTIIKVYKEKGDTGYCHNCPKPFTNKKVKGLTFLWGLKKVKDNYWSNGSILDPKTGKIYRASLTFDKTGTKAYVRGYIGIPLLGRSQTWLRVKA